MQQVKFNLVRRAHEMSWAIELQSLSKTYPRTWLNKPFTAVKSISLQVPEGEVFGFIGPNGAGKSTCIKILTGAMRSTSGQAFLFGISTDIGKSRSGLGYVPEVSSLPDYLTPFEILKMALDIHQVRLDDPVRHCKKWLERFELGHVANKTIRGFSKGMAQRAALAHAMVVRPRLLILDEPLSGLDPLGRKQVVDILAEYKQQGGTIFLTSHVLHDVERLADRFGLIHEGTLIELQSPTALVLEDETVLVRTLGDSFVEGLEQESEGRWRIEISRDVLWPLLEKLEKAGHRIAEIRPALTLEKRFMRMVGKP